MHKFSMQSKQTKAENKMTVIVGFKHQSTLYLACDSMVTAGWDVAFDRQPKVFCRMFNDKPLLIGTAGEFKGNQLLQYPATFQPEKQEPGMSDYEWLVTKFAPAIHNTFKEHKFAKPSGDQYWADCRGIIAYNGNLYGLACDGHISPISRDYDAIGSGSSYASGYLEAMLYILGTELNQQNIISILLGAVQSACKNNAGCRFPAHIMAIDESGQVFGAGPIQQASWPEYLKLLQS